MKFLQILSLLTFAGVTLGLGESEFIAPEPEEVVKTEGGSVHVWSEGFKLFQVDDKILK